MSLWENLVEGRGQLLNRRLINGLITSSQHLVDGLYGTYTQIFYYHRLLKINS